FRLRSKTPRPGRNPRTGELVPIAARRVITFHASPKLKERVQTPARQDRAGYVGSNELTRD
ncbi:MAG: HU family DNA-binding protein, partial [Gallionellaceae bacterium]|nr:HU family DNA-binding protein [Gallionellaceae bacterium]